MWEGAVWGGRVACGCGEGEVWVGGGQEGVGAGVGVCKGGVWVNFNNNNVIDIFIYLRHAAITPPFSLS